MPMHEAPKALAKMVLNGQWLLCMNNPTIGPMDMARLLVRPK